jgi:hypothetical protein
LPTSLKKTVDYDHLRTRQQILVLLKSNPVVAQERMKTQVDKYRKERILAVGDS